MRKYEDFFTDEAIIKVLCQQRIAFCQKTHESQFFDKISQIKKQNESPKILELMPSRSRWQRSPKYKRKQLSTLLNLKDLISTVHKLRKNNAPEDKPWILAQNNLVELTRSKAFSDTIFLDAPKLIPILKNNNSKTEYRLIASYSDNPVDSILIGQCTNYLRQTFDKYFLDCSFAFRSPTEEKPKTHHDAFEQLAIFWQKNQKDKYINAYVAECDIQGFYDTIDHKVILSCYDLAIEQSEIEVDERARKIICAYLDSYSYNQVHSDLAVSHPSINLKNRDETLNSFLYPNIKYGVPQGGALSVFFANLILHNADSVVTKILESQKSKAVYVRYCDDMVIATLDAEVTKQAFEAYIEELEKLRLVHHEQKQEQANSYPTMFWNEKNKTKEYLWGNRINDTTAIPWLAFVGYQLRYDGMVRVRPSSLKKELEKQRKTKNKFLTRIENAVKNGKNLDLSKRELLASLEGRLRAGAIGKRPNWDFSCGMNESDFGWCKGFEKLALEHLPRPQIIAQSQLRSLDRGLNQQVAIAKIWLNKHTNLPDNREDSDENKKPRLKFFGKPRSYAGQLKSNS